MISHKHRLVYLRIHKCGSTTLVNYLRTKGAGMDRAAINLGLKGPPVPRWIEKSGRISLIALYPDYFVFSFVRNPFDRFLSLFLHRTRITMVAIKNQTAPVDDQASNLIAKADYIVPPPFSCLEECAEQKLGGLWNLKEDQYIGQTKYSYWQLCYERHHSQPQAHYLLDLHPPVDKERSCLDGTPCSFIGRLESFERDFTSLCSLLKLPVNLPIKRHRISHERKVATKREHYSTYYTKRVRKLVEKIYARDLELLGYEFEDETRTSVPVSLYDMNQLQEWRTKTTPFRKHIKLYLIKLYLVIRAFLHHPKRALLHLVVRRMTIWNLLYKKPYKHWKTSGIGKPLSRKQDK